MADYRLIAGHTASLAWVALRSYAATILVLTFVGAVLAGFSYYWLREYEWYYGLVAAAFAGILSIAMGFFLGGKRAVAMALAHALGKLRLGQSVVRLLFERMLQVSEGSDFGERGSRITKGLERLPLAQADELLSRAIRSLTGDMEHGGWMRRKIQQALLEAVRKYTAARFREEGAKYGGIDLLKLKGELEQTVDDVLIQRLRGGVRMTTIVVAACLPLVVAVQTLIVWYWLSTRLE